MSNHTILQLFIVGIMYIDLVIDNHIIMPNTLDNSIPIENVHYGDNFPCTMVVTF